MPLLVQVFFSARSRSKRSQFAFAQFLDAAHQLSFDETAPYFAMVEVRLNHPFIAPLTDVFVKWYVDGKVSANYTRAISVFDLVGWVRKQAGSFINLLDENSSLDWAKGERLSIFGYLNDGSNMEKDAFQEAAKSLADYVTFFEIKDKNVAAELGLHSPPSFVLSRKIHGARPELVHYQVPATLQIASAHLVSFIKRESIPPVIHYSPSNFEDIVNIGIYKMIFIVATQRQLEAGVASEVEKAASVIRGDVAWFFIEKNSPNAGHILQHLSLGNQNEPEVLGYNFKSGARYIPTPNMSRIAGEQLVTFAEQIVNNTALKRSKSASIPNAVDLKKNTVVAVVGTTYDALVKMSTTPILLMIYQARNSFKYLNLLEELAKDFSLKFDITFAKMDGDENEVVDLDVPWYPYIVFFPTGPLKNTEMIVYHDGVFDVPSLTDFIHECMNI